MTAEDVADYLNVRVQTVWRWVRDGKLPAYRLGQRWYRFRREDVEAFLEGRRTGR